MSNLHHMIKCTGCHEEKLWMETFTINTRPFCTVCIQKHDLFKNEGQRIKRVLKNHFKAVKAGERNENT